MSRVLLTGGDGFLGSAIRASFAQRDDVSLLEIVRPGAGTRASEGSCEADLTSTESVGAILRRLRPSVVVHAVGRVMGTPEELHRDNVVTTIAVAEAILRDSPETVLVVLGSAAEYGLRSTATPISETDECEPVGAYGHAKRECFLALDRLRASGLRCNYLRIFNPIGPGIRHQVVGSFLQKAATVLSQPEPRIVPMGNLDSVRDFIPTRDVASFVVGLSLLGEWGHTINVCSGRGFLVREIIDRLAALCGSPLVIESHGPAPELLYSIGDAARSAAIARRFPGSERPTSIDYALKDAWNYMLGGQSRLDAMDAPSSPPADSLA